MSQTSEVLESTARVLQAITDKYSASRDNFAFAEYTLGESKSGPSSSASESSATVSASSTQTNVDNKDDDWISPVTIDDKALDEELSANQDKYTTAALPPSWAQTYHYTIEDYNNEEQVRRLAQYVLVLDSLNFCFWPLPGYEYEHLAASLRRTLLNDPFAFEPTNLAKVTPEQLSSWLQPPVEFPLIGETEPCTRTLRIPLLSARTRLLREVGTVLSTRFEGGIIEMIKLADGSAIKLLQLVTGYLPGFRDHAQYGGDQVFFYKRAQIFIGDLAGAFNWKVSFSIHYFHLSLPHYSFLTIRSPGFLSSPYHPFYICHHFVTFVGSRLLP